MKKREKENRAIIKNVVITGTDVFVAGALNPIVSAAWFAVKNIYGLYADLSKKEAGEFFEEVDVKLNDIGKEIIDDKNFKLGLLVQLEALIKTRTEQKRKIIKNIFLNGFLEAENLEKFELEKFNNIVNLISIDNLEFFKKFQYSNEVVIDIGENELGRRSFDIRELENLKMLSGFGLILEILNIGGAKRYYPSEDGKTKYSLTNFGKEFIKYLKDV